VVYISVYRESIRLTLLRQEYVRNAFCTRQKHENRAHPTIRAIRTRIQDKLQRMEEAAFEAFFQTVDNIGAIGIRDHSLRLTGGGSDASHSATIDVGTLARALLSLLALGAPAIGLGRQRGIPMIRTGGKLDGRLLPGRCLAISGPRTVWLT
jgi:hypothetical protein